MAYRTKVAIVYLLGFFVDSDQHVYRQRRLPSDWPRFAGQHQPIGLDQQWLPAWSDAGDPAQRLASATYWRAAGFLLSLVLFMLATAAAGRAGSIEELIGWRVIQGMGGGLLIPIGQTLTYQLFRSHERAGLSAAIMLVGLLAPALSPALGGLIVDHLDWRWVFFSNLPLAAVALLLAILWLRNEPAASEVKRLDVTGLISACLALTLLLLGLTRLSEPHLLLQGAILLFAGLLVFAYYLRHSLHHPHPLLNLRLMRDPQLRIAMVVYQCIPGLFIGVSLVAMLYLQNQLGMSATQVGGLIGSLVTGLFRRHHLDRQGFQPLRPTPAVYCRLCFARAGDAGLIPDR